MDLSTMTGAGAVAGAPLPAAGFADAALVALARDGDREAREELARRCRRPAYVLALQLLGDPDDALDVAQDSLIRLLESFGRFDPSRPLRPWLARIVRNRALDLRRHRRARPTLSLDALLDDGHPEAPAAAEGPEERAERRELQRRIWRALQETSPAHREILVLRDYQDLSYQEIAAVLGVPVGTVMSRLHAARRSLRRALEAGAGPDRLSGGAHHD
jgi:RNA polymerase sigma-70 factor (ECF subfamily)